LNPAVPKPPGLHQAEAYLHLLERAGLTVENRIPRLRVPDLWEERARELLSRAGLGPGERPVGIHPGSTYGTAKRWPLERFARVADRLQREAGVRVVLLGGPGEEALARDMAGCMGTPPLNLAGKTDIPLLAGVLRQCRVLVCNDTGPMHLAAAVGTPVVALFGPTDPSGTAPLGGGHALLRHPVDCSPCLRRECPVDHRCMTGLSVDAVWEAVRNRLLPSPGNGDAGSVPTARKGLARAGEGKGVP